MRVKIEMQKEIFSENTKRKEGKPSEIVYSII